MRRTLPAVLLALTLTIGLGAQNTQYMLDWLPPAESQQGFLDMLHARLSRLLDTVIRYTSPDISRESRRLWTMDQDGKGRCLASADTGVHSPRWSKSGHILYLVEADTNKDGRIDALDDYVVRVVPENGGKAVTVGQGKSAVWSPDGRVVAIASGGEVAYADLDGNAVMPASTPGGRLVMTNSLNPEVARTFLALDIRSKSSSPLPDDLKKKYLWLGAISPSGAHVIFSSATRKELIVVETGTSQQRSISGEGTLVLDPAWAPDEKRIAFVSTSTAKKACAAN